MDEPQKILKPCPFCGSKKVRFLNDRSVQCANCGAGTPDHQAWNERVGVPPNPGLWYHEKDGTIRIPMVRDI